MYDVVQIDHIRGFDEYYSIPYGAKNAVNGHWEKGTGIELFRCMEQQLGQHEVIAEDLGYVTDSVRKLVKDSGFPGMKVLEFAFDSRDTGSANDYLPHNYTENCAAMRRHALFHFRIIWDAPTAAGSISLPRQEPTGDGT